MATVRIGFRVKPDEKEQLERIAQSQGCDISDLCRRGLILLSRELSTIEQIRSATAQQKTAL